MIIVTHAYRSTNIKGIVQQGNQSYFCICLEDVLVKYKSSLFEATCP